MRNDFTFNITRLGVRTLRLLVSFQFLLLQGDVKNVHQPIWQGVLDYARIAWETTKLTFTMKPWTSLN